MSHLSYPILSEDDQIERTIAIALNEDVGTGDISCFGKLHH